MRKRDARVDIHVEHDTTGRYLGQVTRVSANGIVLSLDGLTPIVTIYEVRRCAAPSGGAQ